MSEIPVRYESLIGGIADYPRQGQPYTYAFARSIDVRTDPRSYTVLPRTIKESGSVVTDLIHWGETYNPTLDIYLYGDAGNLYKRTNAQVYSFLRTVPNSHGNGLSFNPEDDFLYYTSDTVIGRYGPFSSTSPTFTDDFLGSQGGVPLNTNSVDFEATSSQYASRADTATTSITGDLSIDLQIKPESLPDSGNTMTLVSKWDESATAQSYKFDLAAISGYFGSGVDSSLTISTDTTEAPIDSTCTGTVSTASLAATNTSFAADQIVLILQTQGSGAGTWMRNSILSYTAGTITLTLPLNATYTAGAQVRVLPQYTNVTINSGITYKAKPWSHSSGVGGILAFIANGTTDVTGTINADGSNGDTEANAQGLNGGFKGGIYPSQGEGNLGTGSNSSSNNGNAGGNATDWSGGAGGGNGTAGSNGGFTNIGVSTTGGTTTGTTDLTTMVFGGGGGSGSGPNGVHSYGGNGGGIVFITSSAITVTGAISAKGGNGYTPGQGDQYSPSGAGAGGSVLLKAQTATLGSLLITATGGTGGNASSYSAGNGGNGRIHLDYLTSQTGTTSPMLDATQDSSLVTNVSYQLRVAVSSDGTNSETLAYPFVPQVGVWQQVGVSWKASTSTATFYQNAIALGTRVGTFTAIDNNASRFALATNYNGSGDPANFYDGEMDEVRLFSIIRTTDDFNFGLNQQIPTNTPGLNAYYKLNGDYSDSSGNSNTLTATNTPVFTVDVPYSSPTTRLDIDQKATTTGDTYTTPIAISEGATDRKTFTPAQDPQKSIAVLIAAVGTGNWTLTVHDQYNNTIASKTVANASLHTGYFEFIFDTVWRPLTNFTNQYHFHLTSTVNDGTVTTTTNEDLETVSFRTYWQFMVEDVWHPIAQFLNFKVIGNERYVATYESPLYDPHRLVLEPGWHVRCFGYWNEYLAIGVTYGSTLTGSERGRIHFWDGVSDFVNYSVEIPEGGINALLGQRGTLYAWAGYQGDILQYTGGSDAQVIKQMPKMTKTKTMEIYPGAVTTWKKLIRFGSAGNTTSTLINQGAYTWGAQNNKYPDILTYDYPVSTGTLTGTSLKIGMLTVVNQKLLMSWQDNTSFGVDYVDDSNPPYPTSTIEFLIEDIGILGTQTTSLAYKQKEEIQIASKYTPLLTGESLQLKYRTDDDTSWNMNPVAVITGSTISRYIVGAQRFNLVQIGCDITLTGLTAPTIKSVVTVIDALEGENVFG